MCRSYVSLFWIKQLIASRFFRVVSYFNTATVLGAAQANSLGPECTTMAHSSELIEGHARAAPGTATGWPRHTLRYKFKKISKTIATA